MTETPRVEELSPLAAAISYAVQGSGGRSQVTVMCQDMLTRQQRAEWLAAIMPHLGEDLSRAVVVLGDESLGHNEVLISIKPAPGLSDNAWGEVLEVAANLVPHAHVPTSPAVPAAVAAKARDFAARRCRPCQAYDAYPLEEQDWRQYDEAPQKFSWDRAAVDEWATKRSATLMPDRRWSSLMVSAWDQISHPWRDLAEHHQIWVDANGGALTARASLLGILHEAIERGVSPMKLARIIGNPQGCDLVVEAMSPHRLKETNR